MSKRPPRHITALAMGGISPACLTAAATSQHPVVIAGFLGVGVVSGVLCWQELRVRGKGQAITTQFASVAQPINNWQWWLGIGRKQPDNAINWYSKRDKANPVFVFRSIPGVVTLPTPVDDGMLLHFCQTAYRWWHDWTTGKDNGQPRTINQVISANRFLAAYDMYTEQHIKSCKLILTGCRFLYDWPGENGRKAGQLVTSTTPSTMVRVARYVWE